MSNVYNVANIISGTEGPHRNLSKILAKISLNLKNSENIGQIDKLIFLGEIREYHNKRKENNTTLKYISRYNSEKKVTQFNLHFGTLVKINASM